MKVSERTCGVEYAIRDIILYARKYESTGKQITYLNIGDPVKYDFMTPEHIKQALIDAVKNNQNYYTESEGLFWGTSFVEFEHGEASRPDGSLPQLPLRLNVVGCIRLRSAVVAHV